MTPEFSPMDPALEEAVREIRDEAVDQAVIEAADQLNPQSGNAFLKTLSVSRQTQPMPGNKSCAGYCRLSVTAVGLLLLCPLVEPNMHWTGTSTGLSKKGIMNCRTLAHTPPDGMNRLGGSPCVCMLECSPR